ncbi:MAG: regulatory protein RecX [Polyangiaceae bacterium]|nr:regulatory protein RecX [Polyangiaceae bacterium]
MSTRRFRQSSANSPLTFGRAGGILAYNGGRLTSRPRRGSITGLSVPISRRNSNSGGKKPELPLTLPKGKLEEYAMGYLNRFDATRHKLASVLTSYIQRHVAADGRDAAMAEAAAMLDRYEANGILSDQRFSTNHARSLHQRGSSRQKTVQKLRMRGVAPEVIQASLDALESEQPGGDLAAALIYVKKRRLGPHRRSDEERQAARHKDLASLARQGFSLDVARRALATTDDDVF